MTDLAHMAAVAGSVILILKPVKPKDEVYRVLARELATVKREHDILKKAMAYFANPHE